MLKKISISLPRIDAEEVMPFNGKDAKGYVMKESDGVVTVIITAKGYPALLRIILSIAGWMMRFIEG